MSNSDYCCDDRIAHKNSPEPVTIEWVEWDDESGFALFLTAADCPNGIAVCDMSHCPWCGVKLDPEVDPAKGDR
jgi:hypothetical protein